MANKNISEERAFEILDKMFDNLRTCPDGVFPEYSWRYSGGKYAIEELLGKEITYDSKNKTHRLLE